MRAYGFSEEDVVQGELWIVDVDKHELLHTPTHITHRMGWVFVSEKFTDAKKALIENMTRLNIDPDLVSAVKGFKASIVQRIESN